MLPTGCQYLKEIKVIIEEMKYRVDLYFSGAITQFIEAEDEQSAYEEAEWNVENMSNREFMKELEVQPDGYDVYEEGKY